MRFIFDKTITVHRFAIYSAYEEYVQVGSIRAIIMPVKAEDVMLTEGDPAKTFKLYCDINEDLKEGDKVIDEEGDVYIVKVIRKFKFKSLSRIEAFINRPNN